MTVIAWDGVTLAADRLATSSGLKMTVNKLYRVGDMLAGMSGDLASCQMLFTWLQNGAEPETFPAVQKDPEQYAVGLLVKPDGALLQYGAHPHPTIFPPQKFAIGSGREFAMGAMAMGADAAKAVDVASQLCAYCGGGVNTMTFEANP